MIRQVLEPAEKRAVAREILEALPEWFANREARERYVEDSAGQLFFADFQEGRPAGFLCLKETGDATVELAVMGVRREAHRRGIGRGLFEAAREAAVQRGYSFMQVKTVVPGVWPEYDGTNLFYRSLGFREFERMPELWGPEDPCQIYVLYLKEKEREP